MSSTIPPLASYMYDEIERSEMQLYARRICMWGKVKLAEYEILEMQWGIVLRNSE